MNIPINQDIETAYRNEFVKGFSLYEFGFAFGGIVAIAFVTFIAWLVSIWDSRLQFLSFSVDFINHMGCYCRNI